MGQGDLSFVPDGHFLIDESALAKALDEERKKRLAGQNYHPILRAGIISCIRPNSTAEDSEASNKTAYHPIVSETSERAVVSNLPEEAAVAPSFFSVEDAQEPMKCESEAQVLMLLNESDNAMQAVSERSLMPTPGTNPFPTAAVLAAEPAKQEHSNGSFVSTADSSSRIKATDVLAALKTVLTLRVVNNALYVYDPPVYRVVDKETMHRLIMRICRQYVNAVGNASIIRQVYDLICADDEIVSLSDTRPAEHLVALENGLLDLHDMAFKAASPDMFVTALIRGKFLRNQPGICPAFRQFLSMVTGGDRVLEQRIWEMIGYILVPDTQGKCFFLLQGVPDSGKSLLGNLIASCFEETAVTSLDITALGQQFAVSELMGKRLCLSLDLASSPWDAQSIGRLKTLTGNDLLTADVKYQPRIKFRNTASFLFATNHAVTTAVKDEAIFHRLVVVPFRCSIPREEQNHQLLECFQQEKDAIITRALQAYRCLRSNNYRFSGEFRVNEVVSGAQGAEAVSLEQAVADFFYSDCVLDPEAEEFVIDLHEAFLCRYPALGEIATFSAALKSFLDVSFPGKISKTRKRKSGAKNATHAFKGLRLKD